ncbi:hypothetical protein MMC09_002167 [Bachmanniomyces sp. S44760]|nr:hypothetical protein [Bachmanniomyces sp. S44760]
MATIVLGTQWGDEGKGKLVDILCSSANLCARAQGGNNAGHTIVANDITYDFHILPSGLVNPKCINVIGSGCVIHIPSFFQELEDLEKKGLSTADRIYMSERAQVVFDLHQLIDGLEEGELREGAKAMVNGKGAGEIGTTRKGIGPAYSTKVARSGVRVHQIFDKEMMDRRLRTMARGAEKRYGGLGSYNVEEEIVRFDTYRAKLYPYVTDVVTLMDDAQKQEDVKILVEGANALMLDIDYGTYPYVTSSNTGIGGVFTGLALNPMKIKEIIGVVKAYTTRVGGGPFPTEQLNETGSRLQTLGHEYGVTTGRTRRCGWLDLVVLKYSTAINHYTSLNLTKLDILDTFPTIRVATHYVIKSTGQILSTFPAELSILGDGGATGSGDFEVIYKDFKGWESKTTGVRRWDDLPLQAKEYIEFIEAEVGVAVKWIGTGPGRESMIVR